MKTLSGGLRDDANVFHPRPPDTSTADHDAADSDKADDSFILRQFLNSTNYVKMAKDVFPVMHPLRMLWHEDGKSAGR